MGRYRSPGGQPACLSSGTWSHGSSSLRANYLTSDKSFLPAELQFLCLKSRSETPLPQSCSSAQTKAPILQDCLFLLGRQIWARKGSGDLPTPSSVPTSVSFVKARAICVHWARRSCETRSPGTSPVCAQLPFLWATAKGHLESITISSLLGAPGWLRW